MFIPQNLDVNKVETAAARLHGALVEALATLAMETFHGQRESVIMRLEEALGCLLYVGVVIPQDQKDRTTISMETIMLGLKECTRTLVHARTAGGNKTFRSAFADCASTIDGIMRSSLVATILERRTEATRARTVSEDATRLLGRLAYLERIMSAANRSQAYHASAIEHGRTVVILETFYGLTTRDIAAGVRAVAEGNAPSRAA